MTHTTQDTVESSNFHQIANPNSKVKQLSQEEIDGETPLSEIFAGFPDDGFTHDEALEIMDITELEFLELLKKSGNCPSGKLDKNRIYSRELIFEIDPEKWILD